MPQLFLNNFQTQFIASVKAMPDSASPALELDYGVLRVSDGAAGLLLNPAPGNWYVLTAFKRAGSAETNYEVMHVTAVDNAVLGECRLTVLRGQEGTVPKPYVAGDILELRLTAGGMNQYVQTTDARMSNARAPAGAAGGVLTGEYPNPGFAQAMATAAELSGKVDKVAGKVLSANDFTNDERVKLANVAEQATKNAPDSQLRDRSTHTGTQAIATITGLSAELAGKQESLVSGVNVKTINGESIVGGGNIVIAGAIDKKFYFHTANTTLTVPAGVSVVRFYAGGSGAAGQTSGGGGGGGFAFGDLAVVAGDSVQVSFASGIATVRRNGTVVGTANPAVGRSAGTASITASVTNGGAFPGGAGGDGNDGTGLSGGGGGGSCGSPLGAGFPGGSGRNPGGGGIGGAGGTGAQGVISTSAGSGGGGAGEAGGTYNVAGIAGYGGASGVGIGRGLANAFADPLLRNAVGPRTMAGGGPGAGGRWGFPGGDFGGGGGGFRSPDFPGGAGGLMGGGGGPGRVVGSSEYTPAGPGGYGGGGGGGGLPGAGGAAFCFLYY